MCPYTLVANAVMPICCYLCTWVPNFVFIERWFFIDVICNEQAGTYLSKGCNVDQLSMYPDVASDVALWME